MSKKYTQIPTKAVTRMAPGEIVCGIDPGFARLGYAFIKFGPKPEMLEAKCIETSSQLEQASRINEIISRLEEKIKSYSPSRIAIEKLFFAKNQKTAMKVAEMRGALLLLASSLSLEIKEYAPSEIKLAVAGSGSADKRAVSKMVGLTLRLKEMPKLDDVTDAIAVALCSLYSN